MINVQIKNRLVEATRPENEWVYLVNETLVGEKTIVPMLKKILESPVCQGPLRQMVERQIDEEVQHVRLFHNLVGSHRIDRNVFRGNFSRFVLDLPSVTLKLFALQGMLEGIAMGALNYRLTEIENSPSLKEDMQALSDESNHTSFSFPHFKNLIESEGMHSMQTFKSTAREANSIFGNSFNGSQISKVFADSFNEVIDPGTIEKSSAMNSFRNISRTHIVKTRAAFLNQYFEAAI